MATQQSPIIIVHQQHQKSIIDKVKQMFVQQPKKTIVAVQGTVPVVQNVPVVHIKQVQTAKIATPIKQQIPVDYQKQIKQTVSNLKTFGTQAFIKYVDLDRTFAYNITQFKRNYVLPIGDIPVRSVIMAVSTGVFYAVMGRTNPSMLGRFKNLSLTFLVNGAFWVPELFNPYLFLNRK